MDSQKTTLLDAPLDHHDRDSAAGAGALFGGLSTGVRGTRGIGDDDRDEFTPGPISEVQHTFDDLDPATDSATTVHSVADLPMEGA